MTLQLSDFFLTFVYTDDTRAPIAAYVVMQFIARVDHKLANKLTWFSAIVLLVNVQETRCKSNGVVPRGFFCKHCVCVQWM